MNANDTLFAEDTPGRYRARDEWTSKAAARAAGPRTPTTRYLLLRLLAGGAGAGYRWQGVTAFEAGAELGIPAPDVGTRLGELAAAGHVAKTNHRRPTDTGRTAAVYVITVEGLDRYSAERERYGPRVADTPRTARTRPPGRPTGPGRPSRRGLTLIADRVLELLVDAGAAGMTDSDIADAAGIFKAAAGTYRLELERAGHVERTARHRLTDRRRPAIVHAITDTGYAELRRRVDALTA